MMELLFQEKKVEFSPNININTIVEKIYELLNDSYYLSYLIVDGINVFEEPEQFLMENLNNIKKIEIVGLTPKELINEVLLSADEYINSAVRNLSDLAEGFYSVPNSEYWNKFNEMLEGVQWLNQVIESIDHMKEKPRNWEEYIKIATGLQEELKNMEEAVISQDYVLIADIIQYEISTIYAEIQNTIRNTINVEGKSK